MAYTGQILDNPVSGERIIFRKTAADTDGELLELDLELAPDGHVPGKHVHPVAGGALRGHQRHHEVQDGPQDRRRRGRRGGHGPGRRARTSSRTAATRPPTCGCRSARRSRWSSCFETAVALANEGRTTSKGMPKPLDLALFVREYADEVQGAFPPAWVQQATMAPLAWVARKRGHAERYAPARPAYAA